MKFDIIKKLKVEKENGDILELDIGNKVTVWTNHEEIYDGYITLIGGKYLGIYEEDFGAVLIFLADITNIEIGFIEG